MRHLFIRDNKIVTISKSSFVVVLSLSLLACGQSHDNARSAAQQASESKTQIPQNPSPLITPTPELEVSFGDGLKIIPVSVNLENQSRRYKIDVVYPQVEGSKSFGILKLNERIKSLVTDEYKWPLASPIKSDLKAYEKFPGISNTVSLSYEVPLATRELVSLYFNAYHYGIGAAHSVQHSFAVNYDVRTGRILNLPDLFKQGAKHLEFISVYCVAQLSKDNPYAASYSSFKEVLSPKAKNYESWNLSKDGIHFNFDACTVDGCAGGSKQVVIPFVALKPMLDLKGPLRSFIEPSA